MEMHPQGSDQGYDQRSQGQQSYNGSQQGYGNRPQPSYPARQQSYDQGSQGQQSYNGSQQGYSNRPQPNYPARQQSYDQGSQGQQSYSGSQQGYNNRPQGSYPARQQSYDQGSQGQQSYTGSQQQYQRNYRDIQMNRTGENYPVPEDVEMGDVEYQETAIDQQPGSQASNGMISTTELLNTPPPDYYNRSTLSLFICFVWGILAFRASNKARKLNNMKAYEDAHFWSYEAYKHNQSALACFIVSMFIFGVPAVIALATQGDINKYPSAREFFG